MWPVADSCYMLAHIFRQNTIDEGLVAHVATRGFLSQLAQYLRIESDRDELARAIAQRRTTDTSHRAKLLV